MYRIAIDGKWWLGDFQEFTYLYGQSYVFLASLIAPHSFRKNPSETFDRCGWRGDGYSAGHFYTKLKHTAIGPAKPQVARVEFASPGIIEILGHPGVFVAVGGTVLAIFKAMDYCHQIYVRHTKEMRDRETTKIDSEFKELELNIRYREFFRTNAEEFADAIDFRQLDELQRMTKSDLRTFKVMRSFYRYSRKLAKAQDSGQIDLGSIEANPPDSFVGRALIDHLLEADNVDEKQ